MLFVPSADEERLETETGRHANHRVGDGRGAGELIEIVDELKNVAPKRLGRCAHGRSPVSFVKILSQFAARRNLPWRNPQLNPPARVMLSPLL
jgi:hypothetical protein